MTTFADPLYRGLKVGPDRLAVIDGDERYTYRELAHRMGSLVAAVSALGLERGERVALLMANGHRYIEAYLALPAAGYVIVPLNARLAEAELRYICADAGVRLLITDRTDGSLDGLAPHVLHAPAAYEAALATAAFDTAAGPLGAIDEAHPDDVAGLFYTGGTTGPSKGVMLSHRNLLANMWNTLTSCGLTADDRYLVMSPMFHAAGTIAVLGCLALGATQVTVPAFDAALVLDTIEQQRITTTLAVPTMLVALCEEQAARPRDVSSLRLMTHGASPVAVETLKRARTVFPTTALTHLYGATELAPLATAFIDEQDHLDGPRARSCGVPVIGCRVEVIDTDGQPLGAGEVGEVIVRGENVMVGYWNKPDETAAALHDGWYRSGDLGMIDADGYLYLVDRAKDMIVSGGENVYSSEVEQALMTHPQVLECAVYAVPDETWGEAVAATVVLRGPATVEELRDHCRALIAGFKVPRQVVISDDPLPKSAAGKILKRELREPYWEGRSERVGGA